MTTYRTLNEIRGIRDSSNTTLRFARSTREAGMLPGPIEGRHRPIPAWYAWAGPVLAALVAGVVLWGLLVLLFSVDTEPAATVPLRERSK